MELRIETFVAPGFAENSYVVWHPDASVCTVIDPGNSIPRILDVLAQRQLTAGAILLTHAHLDHIEGVAQLVRATAAPIYLHPADRFLYDHVVEQGRQFGVRVEAPPSVDHSLQHDTGVDTGGVTYHVRHVPGHSPGHVILHVADAGCAFVGDVVFQGSIGRTDLPGGDFQQLIAGIRAQVLTLPANTVLYPGHGPSTTVGHEAATNPFLIAHYGGGIA